MAPPGVLHPRRALVALASGLLLATTAGGPARAADGSRTARPVTAGAPVAVELVLTAREARWRPSGRRGVGRLELRHVSPRMVMMATPPRDELAVVPASLLGANWNHLFRATRGRTNAVLSVPVRGRPRLFAVRLDLARRDHAGRRLVFTASRLRRTAHAPLPMGRARRTWEGATLLVDPVVTAGARAMWSAMHDHFALRGGQPSVPHDPFAPDGDGFVFDNGFDLFDAGTYNGPPLARWTTMVEWSDLQERILNASGPWKGDLRSPAEELGLTFEGSSYDGLALFAKGNFGDLAFAPASGRVEVTNSALFDLGARSVSFNRADVGGANLRGMVAGQFNVSNSLFQGVDMTGIEIGTSGEGRSTISNSAFFDVQGFRAVDNPDGTPDTATERLEDGRGVQISNTDFTSTTFKDVDFRRAGLESTTFRGCGLLNVDLTNAEIRGPDPTDNASRFEPTFQNAILEGVRLDGARLSNVSFAGVDFSGGGISMEGAVLDNVDFTGATGLQSVNWTEVAVTGNVYGLAEYGTMLNLQRPELLRSLTFDGVVPEIDPESGFDVEPLTHWLIDPATGVRFQRDGFSGSLYPIDPATGEAMRDPQTGDQLVFQDGRLMNPETKETFEVEYESGELRR